MKTIIGLTAMVLMVIAITATPASAYTIDGVNYDYCQNITLDMTTGELPAGYQVRFINLNSSNVGANWNWSNECVNLNTTRARIADSDYNVINWTVLNCDDVNEVAEFAINIEEEANTTGSNYPLCYGNETATPEEHNSDVFPYYFDGFEDDCDLSPWIEESTGGIKEISTTTVKGACSMMMLGVGNISTSMNASLTGFDIEGKIFSFDLYFNNSASGVNAITILGDPSSSSTLDNFGLSWSTGDSCVTSRWYDGSDHRGDDCYAKDEWHTIEARNPDFGEGNDFDIWVDNALDQSGASLSTRNFWSGNMLLADSALNGFASWFDNILVRDYDEHEPNLTITLGTEYPVIYPHQDLPFTDDFSGNLSQWNVTEGSFNITNGVMQSFDDGNDARAYSNVSMNATGPMLWTFKTRALDDGGLTSTVEFVINETVAGYTDYGVSVKAKLGSGFGGNTVALADIVTNNFVTLYSDQNYTYDADLVWYYVKVYLNGTDAKFKIWNESEVEPSFWRWEGTIQTDLSVGYRMHLRCSSTEANEYCEYDDISLVEGASDVDVNVDFVSPTPANGTDRELDWVFINVSNDVYDYGSCTLDWDGSNESMTTSGTFCYLNKTGLSGAEYTYKAYASAVGSSLTNVSEERTIDILTIPDYTKFSSDPETTNFSAEGDLENVTNPVIANEYAKVAWSGSDFDVKYKNLDDAIDYSTNLVSVNVSTIPTFDAPATITLKGVTYPSTSQFVVLRDGSPCTDCVILSASPATFTVTGFSVYTTQYISATEAQPLLVIIPLIIAIAMVVGFVGAFLSGLLDLRTAMTWIVVFTLALAFIGIIFVL